MDFCQIRQVQTLEYCLRKLDEYDEEMVWYLDEFYNHKSGLSNYRLSHFVLMLILYLDSRITGVFRFYIKETSLTSEASGTEKNTMTNITTDWYTNNLQPIGYPMCQSVRLEMAYSVKYVSS